MAVRQRRVNLEDELDEVAYQGRFLMNHYVFEEMQDDDIENAPDLNQLEEPGVQRVPGVPQEHMIEIVRAVKFIGDAMNKDREGQSSLTSLVARVPPGAGEQTLLRVASSIFEDGIFNWGRVVALFNFAYKVCVKAVNSIELMKNIINIIVGFMRRHVAQWILENGGWEGILDYVSSSKRRIGLFVAGGLAICTGAYLYQRYLS